MDIYFYGESICSTLQLTFLKFYALTSIQLIYPFPLNLHK